MLLNAEELLALVNGDAEPDRLADLLDRLENCPDSAAALQVLVALRANRDEGLEALREAADADSTQPVQHPSWRRPAIASTRWGSQSLRLAASIAIVGILGILAATTFFGTDTTAVALATEEYENMFQRDTPPPTEQTATAAPDLGVVADLMEDRRFEEARDLLGRMPDEDPDMVAMYLGMVDYFTENYEQALIEFAGVGEEEEKAAVHHQASWFEANALLALNRPVDALIAFERLVSSELYFQPQAAEKYDALCEALGINSSATQR